MSDEKTQMNAYERPAGSIQVPTRGDTGEGNGQASPVAARIAHLEGLLHAADAALEALGVPNHGEPIAERIRALGATRDDFPEESARLREIVESLNRDPRAPVWLCGQKRGDGVVCNRPFDHAEGGISHRGWEGKKMVTWEDARGTPALTDAEMAAHRGLDAPTHADDEPDPETGWTRVEMRAACSPAQRDFLAAMDTLRDGGSEADGLEAFKAYLRAEHPRPVTPAR